MPSLINTAEVEAAAKAELAKEAFKVAVAAKKIEMKARKQHLLPWQISFQWPVILKKWKVR